MLNILNAFEEIEQSRRVIFLFKAFALCEKLKELVLFRGKKGLKSTNKFKKYALVLQFSN